MLAASVMEFFTGALLPLPFFPEALQPIFYALPFASMQSTPFLIYTGYMRGREALLGLLVQAVWLLLLVVLGRLWMRRAVRPDRRAGRVRKCGYTANIWPCC